MGCATTAQEIKPPQPIREAPERYGVLAESDRFTQRHLDHFHMCANRNPNALRDGRRLEVDFGVTPAGHVNQVRVVTDQSGSDGLAECVSRALHWIRHPSTFGEYLHLRLVLATDAKHTLLVELQDRDSGPANHKDPDQRQAKARHVLPDELTRVLGANPSE